MLNENLPIIKALCKKKEHFIGKLKTSELLKSMLHL